MAQVSPWSVKSVTPEARAAAKIAARKAGMTVGAWLSQTVLAAAARELSGAARPDAASDHAGGGGVANGGVYAAAPPTGRAEGNGAGGPPALTAEAVLANIQKLARRVDEVEHRTSEAVAPLAKQVGALSEQISELKSAGGVSTAPVERAMMRLNERLERIEEDLGRSPTRRAVHERPSRTSSGGGILNRLFGQD